jgi:hypothetical protein
LSARPAAPSGRFGLWGGLLKTQLDGEVSSIVSDAMTRVLRISKGTIVGDILDSIEALQEFAREHGAARYDINVHSLERSPRIERLGQVVGQDDRS